VASAKLDETENKSEATSIEKRFLHVHFWLFAQLFAVQANISAANRRFSMQVNNNNIGGITDGELESDSCTDRAHSNKASSHERESWK
jgi:hypothetical protein